MIVGGPTNRDRESHAFVVCPADGAGCARPIRAAS